MPVDYSSNGYIPKAVAVTPMEAAHRTSHTQVKSICKSAVVGHLGKYFNEDGKYRYLTKSVFPSMLKFVTDLDFVPDEATNADNKVKMPIFKYWNEIKSHMPCIVISGSDLIPKSSGIGRDQGVIRAADRTCYRIVHIIRSLNCTLSVFAGDQGTTESIVDVLSLIFGELNGFTSGFSITDESAGGHWLIRLPRQPELGGVEHNNQGDDVKDQYWSSMTTLNLDYEDSFLVPFTEPHYEVQRVSPGNMPKCELSFPEVVHVNRQAIGIARHMQPQQSLSSSNPSVLTIKPGAGPGQYYLFGRKPGEASLRVLDGTAGDSPGGGVRPTVIAEIVVKVAY
jgi:hypothetical protein